MRKKKILFSVYNPLSGKLLTRLRLQCSHINKQRFKHGFGDTINPMSACGTEFETTEDGHGHGFGGFVGLDRFSGFSGYDRFGGLFGFFFLVLFQFILLRTISSIRGDFEYFATNIWCSYYYYSKI